MGSLYVFTYMYFRWMKKRYSLEFQYWVKPTVRRMGGNRGGQMHRHLPFLCPSTLENLERDYHLII